MPVESNPIFQPEVIRQHVRSFKLPVRVRESRSKLLHWVEPITSGRIFCQLLGSTRSAGPADIFTLSRETHVEARSQRSRLKGEL